MQPLTNDEVRHAVRLALKEDVGAGDATTLAVVPEALSITAVMRAREPLVLAGLALAQSAFQELSSAVRFEQMAQDGQQVSAGAVLMEISGPAQALLTAERVALNFVQRLSGIATLTARFVEAVQGTAARILDTRKTTPGWRRLEKYAVTCGGGHNHRFGLYDMVLIKDNHLASLRAAKPNAVAAAISLARAKYPLLKIEVEADTLEQVEQAMAAGAGLILLDNMSPDELRRAVEKCRGRAQTEASGGIGLKNVRAIAESGVDFISIGALTHSARAVDIGLDFR